MSLLLSISVFSVSGERISNERRIGDVGAGVSSSRVEYCVQIYTFCVLAFMRALTSTIL